MSFDEALLALIPIAVIPLSIRTMKRWLRKSGSGKFVGSVVAGIATTHDPTAMMIAEETEKNEMKKKDEDKEGSNDAPHGPRVD